MPEKQRTSELDRAVRHLEQEYERAKKNPAVRNPLAWALYQTWKWADGKGW